MRWFRKAGNASFRLGAFGSEPPQNKELAMEDDDVFGWRHNVVGDNASAATLRSIIYISAADLALVLVSYLFW